MVGQALSPLSSNARCSTHSISARLPETNALRILARPTERTRHRAMQRNGLIRLREEGDARKIAHRSHHLVRRIAAAENYRYVRRELADCNARLRSVHRRHRHV